MFKRKSLNTLLLSAVVIVPFVSSTACASDSVDHFRYDLIPKAPSAKPEVLNIRAVETNLFLEEDVEVLLTLTGEQATDGFGWVAEDLGDINGDGANDFIVTAPFFATNLPFSAGKAYVYSGADGRLLNAITSQGVPVLGYSAKDAGDVNGDGITDYIVGSFSNATVFSGANHAILQQWFKAGEFFGSSVAGVGDINGDGFGDLVVGARYSGSRKAFRGRVYAYSGSDGSLLWERKGKRAGNQLGTALGSVGDVNYDGIPDVVAGARGAAKGDGRTYILSGKNGRIIRKLKPTGEPGLVTDGAGVTAGTFGLFHAFGVGDVNGDQVADVYVGDYNARQNEIDGTGRGYLFSGATGKRLQILSAENPSDGLGPARGVGDVDQDGHSDIFVAAYTYTGGSNVGKGYLYSGANQKLLRTMTGIVSSQFLGVDALGVGDVNGDGLTDYMLTGSGVLHIVAGSPLPQE